jgi:hypothetical protein
MFKGPTRKAVFWGNLAPTLSPRRDSSELVSRLAPVNLPLTRPADTLPQWGRDGAEGVCGFMGREAPFDVLGQITD